MKKGPPQLSRRQGREAEEMEECIPRADRNEEGEIKSGELEVYRNGFYSNYCRHLLKEQGMEELSLFWSVKSSACFPDH